MRIRVKAGLAAVAVTAALVPLLGRAQPGTVVHDEWARMLLRAMDLDEAVPAAATRTAFSVLSWRSSLSFPAERYLRAAGVQIVGAADADNGREVVAREADAELVYLLGVARRGDYRLRVRMAGEPTRPAVAEIRRLNQADTVKQFTLVPSVVRGWVDTGTTHLDPGAYAAALVLPQGTAVNHLEVAPPCLSAIEPPGGWREKAVLQSSELAVTTLQAVDDEEELPPAATPIDVSADAFRLTAPAAVLAAAGDERELRAGPAGLQAQVMVDLPEAGLYTVSVFGADGAGQSWLADECHKAVICPPEPQAVAVPAWHVLMTTDFTAGRHSLSVKLGAGASVSRVRFERKKEAPADYVAALGRLGFEAGAEGAVSRGKAEEAIRFIEARRQAVPDRFCGDLLPPGETALLQPALPAVPQGALFSGAGPAPLSAPEVAPQPAASLVSLPAISAER